MENIRNYKELLREIRGKVIAVVYIFEGEDAVGYTHYDVWKGDLIGELIQAVQELNCLPLIFDARTFVQKAMDRSLPTIDFAVNLNNGNVDVNTLGMIPSVCSFLKIPCVPCSTTACIVGENKLLSNILAVNSALQVPAETDRNSRDGIIRPLSYGSSIGVVRGSVDQRTPTSVHNVICQEFIPGFDMTTPILYNPLTDSMEVLPPVAYFPEDNNVEWFLGEEQKRKHSGYSKKVVTIDQQTQDCYLSIIKTLSIKTYCRIDARVRCSDAAEMQEYMNSMVPYDRIYFLEINPMPTIKAGINFHTSLEHMAKPYGISACIECYFQETVSPSLTGFILSCALISSIKAKYGKSSDSIRSVQ